MSDTIARLARVAGVMPVETDFGGPSSQALECMRCHTVWRIYRDRAGSWPAQWWHCPNRMKHPPADDPIRNPSAAA